MKLDFFARRENYIDHLAPIWNAFPPARRGNFYVDLKNLAYAKKELGNDGIIVFNGNSPGGTDPILTCAYGDMMRAARNEKRKIVSMEHGTGHTFGTASYPDGAGKRSLVHLSLMPNEYTARKARAVRETPCEIIGTPKTDWIWNNKTAHISYPGKPIEICISFHWGDRQSNPPESGSAWDHYRWTLPPLKEKYGSLLIAHGHPISARIVKPIYEKMGIEFVDDFREVCRRAAVYINDLSSTLYEFLLTGKPVIVLNAPWFRQEMNFGIRFWDYSDVGINLWRPADLFPAIEKTLEEYDHICEEERLTAIRDLYPWLGTSTTRAVDVLMNYLEGLGNETQPA